MVVGLLWSCAHELRVSNNGCSVGFNFCIEELVRNEVHVFGGKILSLVMGVSVFVRDY